MMMVAEAKVHTDERRRAEARRNDHWTRDINWLRIGNHWRGWMVVTNRSRMSDNDRRGCPHGYDLRRS